jgi:hypothetical protein
MARKIFGYDSSVVPVTNRTPLSENPRGSKAVLRYGRDGSKSDFHEASTGQSHIERADRDPDPVRASAAARHVGRIGPARVEVVGHAPDGSGKWLKPTFDKDLIGNAIATHPALRPEGLSKSASGIGKVSQVPNRRDESYRTRGDSGALAGDSHPRPSYTGGRGKIQP